MKNFKKIFFTTIAVIFLYFSSLAQNKKYKYVANAGVGLSLANVVVKLFEYDPTAITEAYSIPAFQTSFDYGILNWLSVGVAGSYQKMGLDVSYQDEKFKIDAGRLNYSLRTLFHYGNLERFDLYSGLRIGMTNWSVRLEENITDFEFHMKIPKRMIAPQLILFGARGYITDNIGTSLEFTIGAPYFVAGGVNYRF